MYKVFRTQEFDRYVVRILSVEEQREVERLQYGQLAHSPYVGKPLRYPFFREKRLGGKRIYYLIYDDLRCVLLVAASTKKHQQYVIDQIHGTFEDFRKIAMQLCGNDPS